MRRGIWLVVIAFVVLYGILLFNEGVEAIYRFEELTSEFKAR